MLDPKDTKMNLKIYNISGKCCKVVFKKQKPGEYNKRSG